MFINGYTKKIALQDVLKFVGYRVHNPTVEVTAELLNAEARLKDLTSTELLDIFGDALRCGVTPGIAARTTMTNETPPKPAGRFAGLGVRKT